jgi:GNAT superfamily N-acetyltransferase
LNGRLLIRKAAHGDIAAILALLADDDLAKLGEGGVTPQHESAFEAVDCDKNQFLAVAEREGKIVGTLQITFIPGLARSGMWRAQIEGVRIARPMRGQGLGHELLRWAIDRSKDRNCKLIQLFMDKRRSDAHRFYEELGFKANHQGFRLYL